MSDADSSYKKFTPAFTAIPYYTSNQDVFDVVAEHMLRTGRPVRSGPDPIRDSCVYKNDEGAKCGVGALIPDVILDAWLEDGGYNNTRSFVSMNLDVRSGTINGSSSWVVDAFGDAVNYELVSKFQNIHDNRPLNASKTPRVIRLDWAASLRHLALSFDLNSQVVDRVMAELHEFESAE